MAAFGNHTALLGGVKILWLCEMAIVCLSTPAPLARPPTPARSGASRPGLYLPLLGGLARWAGVRTSVLALLYFAYASAVQILPAAPEGIPFPRYSVDGHFPWRAPLERQDLRHVCRDRVCRLSLLCPWRGPQGIYHTGRFTNLDAVWAHYYETGRPQELVPVWPCLTADRIWFVPRIHIAGALKCAVVQYDGQFRAVAIPSELSHSRLVLTLRYLTGWNIGSIRLPPGLSSRSSGSADDLQLRDGDLFDALSPGEDGGRYIIRSPSDIKDHVLWSRAMVLQRPTHVRLWTPDMRPSILTCLPAPTTWHPDTLTFSGDFSTSYPGRWVPAPWTPCRVPQLVRVADDADTANILYEDSTGVRCINVERYATPRDLVEGTSESARGTRVLGMLSLGTQAPLCLRDGDVVVTGPLLRAVDSAWPDLRNAAPRLSHAFAPLWWLSCLVLVPNLRLGCLLLTLGSPVRAMQQPVCGERADRSRSRSSEPRRAISPRLGAWGPERRHPMSQVLTRSECHYQVLCPFRGWGEVQSYSRTSEFAHFLQAVHRDAGTWASGYLPVGGEDPGHFTTILPLPPSPFAIVMMHSADVSRSVLLPAFNTLRQVSEYLTELGAVPGLRLRAPPALRRVEGYLDEPIRLRHGDTFEVDLGPWHPRARRREALSVPSLTCLPHLNAWHVTAIVGTRGWVNVWGTTDSGDSYCNRFWISDGSLWSPTWLMFSHRGSSVSSRRWVPVPHLPDQEVSFVEQPDIDEAHVLLVCPHDVSATRCYRLLLAQDASRAAFHRLPEGWQLRPDIEARVVKPWPRNGGVYIPRLAGRLFQSGVVTTSLALSSKSWGLRLLLFLTWISGASAEDSGGAGAAPLLAASVIEPCRSPARHLTPLDLVVAFAIRRPCWAALVGWSCLHVPATGMFAPPLEQQQLAPVPVGRFPWRLAPADRACHESVLPQNPARLLSPFTGLSDEIIITPDSLVDEVRILLSSDEPFWYRDIVPLWPAIWQLLSLCHCHLGANSSASLLPRLSGKWRSCYRGELILNGSWLT